MRFRVLGTRVMAGVAAALLVAGCSPSPTQTGTGRHALPQVNIASPPPTGADPPGPSTTTPSRSKLLPPASGSPASSGLVLRAGQRLLAGQSQWSSRKQYQLIMQGDGNLVEYTRGRALWDTSTGGHPGAYAVLQGDGNLVVYAGHQAIWNSGTENHPGAWLELANTGELRINTSFGRPIWSSVVAGWSTTRLAESTIIVPVDETDLSAVDTEVAKGAGGVILFGSSAPANLGTQIGNLERLVPNHAHLFVMTDEEGGGVQRMANLVGNLPWASYMGAHWTPATITSNVAAVAKRMAGNKVNTDLAPVVDVDARDVPPSATDPDGWRSFSGKTGTVSTDGIAYLHGLEQGGVLPVIKHFPGLGGATGNTDYAPADTLPWATEKKVGLPTFVDAIHAGAPAIMVSNAIVPGLTSLPASLSPTAINHELLGVLHFRGLVMTDTLSAGAISGAGYSIPAATVQSLRAGSDMTMYTSTTGNATSTEFNAVVSAVVNAVANGTLSRSALVAAATAVHAAG